MKSFFIVIFLLMLIFPMLTNGEKEQFGNEMWAIMEENSEQIPILLEAAYSNGSMSHSIGSWRGGESVARARQMGEVALLYAETVVFGELNQQQQKLLMDSIIAYSSIFIRAQSDFGKAKQVIERGLAVHNDPRLIHLAASLEFRNSQIPILSEQDGIDEYPGDLDKSFDLLNKVLEMDPERPESLHLRGIIYALRSDFDAANKDRVLALSLWGKVDKSLYMYDTKRISQLEEGLERLVDSWESRTIKD